MLIRVRAAATLVFMGLISVGLGGWLALAQGNAATPPSLGAVPATTASPAVVAVPSSPEPSSRPEPPPASPPVRLTLPAGPDAAVIPVRVGPGGLLNIPEDPDVLGWWRSGAQPGAGRGGVVIVGHVDSAEFGVGVFARLRGLQLGERIAVADAAGGSHDYRVQARVSYPKASLPAAEVFSQTVEERLVLITCTGRYDRRDGGYPDNLVLYAVPSRM